MKEGRRVRSGPGLGHFAPFLLHEIRWTIHGVVTILAKNTNRNVIPSVLPSVLLAAVGSNGGRFKYSEMTTSHPI